MISKVITFGAFKINFPFLHSIWLMQRDKVCSQPCRRQREVAVVRIGHWSFLRFTSSTEKPVPNHCVGMCVLLCVTVSVPLRHCYQCFYACEHKPTCKPCWVRFPQYLTGQRAYNETSQIYLLAYHNFSCTWHLFRQVYVSLKLFMYVVYMLHYSKSYWTCEMTADFRKYTSLYSEFN